MTHSQVIKPRIHRFLHLECEKTLAKDSSVSVFVFASELVPEFKCLPPFSVDYLLSYLQSSVTEKQRYIKEPDCKMKVKQYILLFAFTKNFSNDT